jgi:hypothetical protein
MSITTAEDPTPNAVDSAPAADELAPQATVSALPAGLIPLLSTDQLMEFYGVSNWTVNEWVKKGCPVEPTAFRGRRFDLTAVRAWMAAESSAMAHSA